MEINQKKRSNRLKFTFNDDSFNYAYKDRTGSGDIDVQYAGFPTKASVSIEGTSGCAMPDSSGASSVSCNWGTR